MYCIYSTCFYVCVCMNLCFLVESLSFLLLNGFQAVEEALAARECNSSSSADLHRRLTNWFDTKKKKICSWFPLVFSHSSPLCLSPLTFCPFISLLQQLFFLNLFLLSHDEPRGILVLYSNSLAPSDPSFIWYFLSSLHCSHSASFLFSSTTFIHAPMQGLTGAEQRVT